MVGESLVGINTFAAQTLGQSRHVRNDIAARAPLATSPQVKTLPIDHRRNRTSPQTRETPDVQYIKDPRHGDTGSYHVDGQARPLSPPFHRQVSCHRGRLTAQLPAARGRPMRQAQAIPSHGRRCREPKMGGPHFLGVAQLLVAVPVITGGRRSGPGRFPLEVLWWHWRRDAVHVAKTIFPKLQGAMNRTAGRAESSMQVQVHARDGMRPSSRSLGASWWLYASTQGGGCLLETAAAVCVCYTKTVGADKGRGVVPVMDAVCLPGTPGSISGLKIFVCPRGDGDYFSNTARHVVVQRP